VSEVITMVMTEKGPIASPSLGGDASIAAARLARAQGEVITTWCRSRAPGGCSGLNSTHRGHDQRRVEPGVLQEEGLSARHRHHHVGKRTRGGAAAQRGREGAGGSKTGWYFRWTALGACLSLWK
jgi:hypothetical protein